MYNIGTTFIIKDQSAIPSIEETVAEPKEVVFLSLITSDKGPEEFMKVSGSDFYDYFGKNISFAKHGQPLLQAAKIINAGGTLLVKRLVDADATLANAYITAEVAADTAAKDVKISFDTGSVQNAAEAKDVVAGLPTNAIFVVMDNGRGTSAKSFNITAEYAYSKNLNYTKYSAKVMENYKDLEKTIFNLNSSIVENGEINTFDHAFKNSKQVKASFNEDNFNTFLGDIVKQCYIVAGYTEEAYADVSDVVIVEHVNTLKTMDVLFCTGLKSSEPLKLSIVGADDKVVDVKINVASTSKALDEDTGIILSEGSHGNFTVFADEEGVYEAMATNFLSGVDTDDIYDVDNYMIDACVDANYPDAVKTKILDLAEFRGDFFFFRDMGTASTLKDWTNIEDKLYGDDAPAGGIYVSDCSLFYNTTDPYTKKEITVTYGYKLAELLVDHMMNNRNRPVAGLLYGMVFDDAIKGTVNYIPMRKPQTVNGAVSIIDEREYMHDARINYAAYYDGSLVLDSQYTRNPIYSQLSFINNILITQQVIKAIRKECPKSRFAFLTGQDLERYSEAVNKVIAKYKDNFNSIEFQYVADPTMVANKIYNASIIVKYKDFVQSEIFTIFALPNE